MWRRVLLENIMSLNQLGNSPCFMNFVGSFHVHKIPVLDPILNEMDPVHTLPPSFFNEVVRHLVALYHCE